MNCLKPEMIVYSWESLILERKVLVTSSTQSLIAPCCEFLRRLILPLILVQAYVPVTSVGTMNVIEAPFPYLVGVHSDLLGLMPWLDYSDIVVVDIDSGSITVPSGRDSGAHAPKSLVNKLKKDVSTIIMKKLDTLVRRPTNLAPYLGMYHVVFNEESEVKEGNLILKLFMKTNMHLMSGKYR